MSSDSTSLLATGVLGVVMLVATVPILIWVDKIIRKPILTIGALGMAFCHLSIAVIFASNGDKWESQQPSAWACIVLVWAYVAFIGWYWGPCERILVAEVWPLSARPYRTAIATSANWMNNFIVGQVTSDMIAHIRYGAFMVFGILIALGAWFVWFFTPETSRLTLEEKDFIFGSLGVAQAGRERMIAINHDIGLDSALATLARQPSAIDEKPFVSEHEEGSEQAEAKAFKFPYLPYLAFISPRGIRLKMWKLGTEVFGPDWTVSLLSMQVQSLVFNMTLYLMLPREFLAVTTAA